MYYAVWLISALNWKTKVFQTAWGEHAAPVFCFLKSEYVSSGGEKVAVQSCANWTVWPS